MGIIVVGAQWGDEGKGKLIDFLSASALHVVRAQGGNNAGHTIMVGEEEYKLHLVPSGILFPHTRCYIGSGCVIDPDVLLAEIEQLEARGIDLEGRLILSPGAHVILPKHRDEDRALEKEKGGQAVGTTGRGIGPCYADKVYRTGLRLAEWEGAKKDKLKRFFGPVSRLVNEALDRGDEVLFEGAQGTFLDTTFGTYPYVTSSSTLAAGILAGAGVGPMKVNQVVGVAKAYTTRVGAGALPSALRADEVWVDPIDARELGTTTGRVRRLGWFDAFLVRTAVQLNGISSLALTKLDVLDLLKELKICVGYRLFGQVIDDLPYKATDWDVLEPIYETLPGWRRSTREVRSFEQLPVEARRYVERIEALCGAPVEVVSVGPRREETITK
ncbi:MAG: adenylosuccinate synthetase [Verrucomicrobia bacterium]|nr:adenylosuccinate synthetase [Verrucomicrobiota bacterium]